jgi:putative transposase
VPTGPRKAELSLTRNERAQLTSFSRSRTLSSSLVIRAKLILACATGATNTEVAQKYGVSLQMVGRWRSRFVEQRVNGLFGDLGHGRPRAVENERRVAELAAEARRQELETGFFRLSVGEVVKQTGIPRASVYTYLKRLGVRL